MPEEKVPCKCLSIIILDSVRYAYEKYHPQTFLDECKYVQEKIKTKNYIDQDLKSESDNDNDTDTDNNEQIYKKSKSDNDEYILTQQSLIVYVNHALLGFYFRQSV